MRYRRYGKTELQMPVLTCGGMRYQWKWQDVPPNEIPAGNQANLEATIGRAVELGIYHIETARGYGTSEMQLGRILPKFPRDKILVQTKVAPMPETKNFLKTFQQSMDYLQLDYVDLLSLHGINNRQHLRDALKPGGCLEAARKLQREGRCRFVGFSTHATTDIILDAVTSGGFDYMNVHWYFVNDLNWAAVEAANARDMGVFIISPNDKGGKLYSPPRKMVELCQPLSPMIFNDLYCLTRPQVHTSVLAPRGRAILMSMCAHSNITKGQGRPWCRPRNACAPRWSAFSGQDGAATGSKESRNTWIFQARSTSARFFGCGLMRSRSI